MANNTPTKFVSVYVYVECHELHSVFVCVLIDESKTGLATFIAYACRCKVDERVLSCCAHVATISRCFAFAPFATSIDLSAEFPNNYFVDGSVAEKNED